MQSNNPFYRPDIDGLRAIAVIFVLLFHFDLGVSGGFIGVDVFFVISGYLITDVVRKAVLAEKFSFFRFYARRLLRLQPALMATTGAALIAGFALMDPASFASLADSARHAILASSNFFFWQHQGYFEAGAKTQPLLHTWSLATEWQFYLIWPAVVWLSMMVSERFLRDLLIAAILISLVASQWMLTYDASAAYFMMPFRIFELAIGALLTLIPDLIKKSSAKSALTIASLLCIFVSAFTLTSSSAFPGVYALPACLGAAGCIYSGRSAAGGLLRSWPMVKIGIISYSVYLVHWPLLVFYKYYIFRPIGLEEKFFLLIASFILGAGLYFSIERKFMHQSSGASYASLIGGAAMVCLALVACTKVMEHEGMLSRVPEANRAFIGNPVQFHIHNYGGYDYPLSTELGDADGKTVAVIGGDSFALQYAYGLDGYLKASKENMPAEFQHGCPLSGKFTRIVNNSPQENCRQTYKRLMEKLENNNLPLIIAQHWAGYRGELVDANNHRIASQNDDDYKSALTNILDGILVDIGERKLIIIGSQPILPEGSATQCLMRPVYFPQPCLNRMNYEQKNSLSAYVNSILSEYSSRHSNVSFIDPGEKLCSKGHCNNFSGGKILYSDSVHLSREGSTIASQAIFDKVNTTTN